MSLEGKDVTVFTGISPKEADEWLKKRDEQYEKTADGYQCKTCGSPIMQTTLHISVHWKIFSGCAGSGEVKTVPFSYCPKCDGKPAMVRACIHV